MGKIRGLIAAAVTVMAIGTGPVRADDGDPLSRFFPASSGFSATSAKDITSNDVRTYSGVTLRSDAMVISIDEVTFGLTQSAQISVHVRNMTIRPTAPGAPLALMADLRMELSDWPNMSDEGCGLAGVARKLELGALEMRYQDPDDLLSIARFSGIGFEHRKAANGCWLSGLTSLARAEIRLRNEVSMSFVDARAQISLPPGLTHATKAISEKSGIRAEIGEIEFRNAGNTPAVGMRDASFRADLDTQSLEGLFKVYSASTFHGARANAALNIMQVFNAISLIRMEASMEAPITRIYSAGVVPPEAVTNFSRVGLSTITGESSYKISIDKGVLKAGLKTALIGLFRGDVDANFMLTPYPMQKLQAAAAGIDLGAHLIPDVSLLPSSLNYTDTGLEGYVIDLTGVPTGRYIEEYAALMANEGSQKIGSNMRNVSSGLIEFFRYAASGFDMHVTASPREKVNASKMTLLALTDVAGLIEVVGLEQTRTRPQTEVEDAKKQ